MYLVTKLAKNLSKIDEIALEAITAYPFTLFVAGAIIGGNLKL